MIRRVWRASQGTPAHALGGRTPSRCGGGCACTPGGSLATENAGAPAMGGSLCAGRIFRCVPRGLVLGRRLRVRGAGLRSARPGRSPRPAAPRARGGSAGDCGLRLHQPGVCVCMGQVFPSASSPSRMRRRVRVRGSLPEAVAGMAMRELAASTAHAITGQAQRLTKAGRQRSIAGHEPRCEGREARHG